MMFKFTSEETKVFLAICRKTIGWHKLTDKVSYSQIMKMTGIKHHQTIKKAVDKLVRNKFITRQKTKSGYIYDVAFTMSPDDTCHSMAESRNSTAMSPNSTPMSRNDTDLCHPVTPQKKKDTLEKDTYIKEKPHFEIIWNQYPSKVGRKAALKHFLASVKTKQDFESIQKALKNYKNSERVSKGFIQNGSTWFNDWQGWVDPSEPAGSKQGQVKKDEDWEQYEKKM